MTSRNENNTSLLGELSPDMIEALGQSVPFPRRVGMPTEFADLVVSIVENSYLNGETIRLDGALRVPPK